MAPASRPEPPVAAVRPTLALDENFPPIVLEAAILVPEIEVVTLRAVDPRLAGLSDRRLVLALHQLGLAGLITNNYKMLKVPAEIAAIVATKLTIIAIQGVGHDPLRATGSLMLDLPPIARRLTQDGPRGHVFLRNPTAPRPERPWSFLQKAADNRHREPSELWHEVRPSDEEMTTPVLP